MINDVILIDSRENDNKFLLEQFKEMNVKYVTCKLYVGDYMIANKGNIAVDKKADLVELAGNIANKKEHIRFRNEIERAKEANIKLYILIKDEYIYNIEGVKYFKSPVYKSNGYKIINGVRIKTHSKGDKVTQANFEALGKAMKTMEEKYGCKFVFSKKENFGKKILELLGVI